jgi:flagellar basal body P-ring formation protein FlgA
MRLSRIIPFLAAALFACAAGAESLVAARTIRAGEAIGPGDLRHDPATIPGALSDPADLIGLEARRMLYVGRPIMPHDVGMPSIVRRNDIVPIVYSRGTLSITTEGRVLDDGAAGDRVRVMNLGSRQTVFGIIDANGAVQVGRLR